MYTINATLWSEPNLGGTLCHEYTLNFNIEDPSVCAPCTPTNVALGKPATQSSTFNNKFNKFGADNGVDGDNNGHHNSFRMTHTKFDSNAWWEVDLGAVYDLSFVKLWNRTNCCANRLTNFHVLVSDVPFNSQDLTATIGQTGVDNFHHPGTAGRETDVTLNRTGRYLRVQLGGTNALQLAEVEIMGCPINSSGALVANTNNLQLDAQLKRGAIDITWINNLGALADVFEIEKSKDGFNFETLEEQLPVASLDYEVYQSVDYDPLNGYNYYRIKMIMTDGSFLYSEVKRVKVILNNDVVTLFPNPAINEVFISMKELKGKKGNIQISDQMRRVFFNQDYDSISEYAERIELTEMPSGIYFVFIKAENRRMITKRLVIIDED